MISSISRLIASQGLPEWAAAIITSAVICAAVCAMMPVIGYIIEIYEITAMRMISRRWGRKKAMFVCNKLTFIGVIAHELAHALLAFMSGAHVDEIVLFNPFSSKELGYVKYSTRGGLIKSAFQTCLTSCAPVLIGLIALYFCIKGLIDQNMPIIAKVPIAYAAFSIFCHMSMSKPDRSCYYKGLAVMYPVFTLITFLLIHLLAPA